MDAAPRMAYTPRLAGRADLAPDITKTPAPDFAYWR